MAKFTVYSRSSAALSRKEWLRQRRASKSDGAMVVVNQSTGGASSPTTGVNIDILGSIPTKVSQLANDSNYQTLEQVQDALSTKVDKVSGKGLSTEDFTSALKSKLEGLSNYNDKELANAISSLRNDFDDLVSGDTSKAIETFNEIVSFLNGIEDTQSLESIIASIETQIGDVRRAIPSRVSALQNDSNYTTESYVSGRIDAQTSYLEERIDEVREDIESNIPDSLADLSSDSTHRTVTDTEKATWNAKSNFSGSYNDLTNKPTIPTAVSQLSNDKKYTTESDVQLALGDLVSELDGALNEMQSEIESKIPTKVSQLSNDSGYQTAAQVQAAILKELEIFNSMFELVNIGTSSNPQYAIRAKYGLYSDSFISAGGLNSK